MRCAVIGCGLAGLGAATALKRQGAKVHLFDKAAIGAGASGIASGLLHSYVGKKGVRSKFAEKALKKSFALIDLAEETLGRKVALRNGILRMNWEPPEMYSDLKKEGDHIMITSGATVFMKSYLEGLYQALGDCKLSVGELVDEEKFDQVLYSIGGGFKTWDLEGVQFVKGQILTCKAKEKCERSIIGSGHISPLEDENLVQIGSTYEYHAPDNEPNLEVAKKNLKKRVETFLPPLDTWEIKECQAGVRVRQKETYLPLIKRVDEKRVIFTGLGSRGILYHAMYGEMAAKEILR